MMNAVVRDLQTLFGMGVMGALSDGQLLDRFVERREDAVLPGRWTLDDVRVQVGR